MKIMDISEISKCEDVLQSLNNVLGLQKPNSDIKKYLNNVSLLYKQDTVYLEKYLSIFTVWQNYFAELVAVSDVVRVVAERQMEYYYSVAVSEKNGSINQKKELARSDKRFNYARKVYEQAKSSYDINYTNFENCGRAFSLASRILTKRLAVKE